MNNADVKNYYGSNDYNCAEALLLFANEKYGLNISADDVKLVGGFGGGFGCGMVCGALCGAIAAIGRIMITDRAHRTPDFKAACTELVNAFEKKLGAIDCCDVKAIHFSEETKCLRTVELAQQVLEEFALNHGIK